MKNKRITMIGTGYVGLVSGVCFAKNGFQITCVDVIKEKIDAINSAQPFLYEKGLDTLLKDVVSNGMLRGTTDTEEAILNSDVAFICVGTPSKENGEMDTVWIESAARDIGRALRKKDDYFVVTAKSTIVPGTTDSVIVGLLEEESGKKAGKDFGVAFCPEFLREGSAIEDFLQPDRVVIGAIDERSYETIHSLFEWVPKGTPILKTDLRTAEMIKYGANSFLATKISFINEISNICEALGVKDVYEVAEGIGLDFRISPYFLRAGAGFGGSCFPKDVKAIIAATKKANYDPILLNSVIEVNKRQPLRLISLTKEEIGDDLSGKQFAILGLAFKPDTDDIREAPAIIVIDELLKNNAKIKAYDPEAMNNMKQIFGEKVQFTDSKEAALRDADVCIIVTNWKEFTEMQPNDFKTLMKTPIVIDGRKTVDEDTFLNAGVAYRRIGLKK
ncbi:MAG: UDP-glucose dehydrogenase family protein [Promethearchaeota archaeon]